MLGSVKTPPSFVCFVIVSFSPIRGSVLVILLDEAVRTIGNGMVAIQADVTIGPGATVLTRMPRPTSSAAAVRVRDRNAVGHAGVQNDRCTVVEEGQCLLNREVCEMATLAPSS